MFFGAINATLLHYHSRLPIEVPFESQCFSQEFFLLLILHLVRLHKYLNPIGILFFGEINATLLHYHRRFTR